jgi:hypothetical protein
MRKLIASLFVAVFGLVLTVMPAVAGSIGPTP